MTRVCLPMSHSRCDARARGACPPRTSTLPAMTMAVRAARVALMAPLANGPASLGSGHAAARRRAWRRARARSPRGEPEEEEEPAAQRQAQFDKRHSRCSVQPPSDSRDRDRDLGSVEVLEEVR